MTTQTLSNSEQLLEEIIDTWGLGETLEDLERICHQKAAHLESIWQDKEGAKVWRSRAKSLEKLAYKVAQDNQP